MSQADETKYYQEHLNDFQQPEQIRLSEILIPLPETASATEIAQGEKKANEVKTKVMQGDAFADLAKKYSGGPSAAQGGELGLFKRGALAKVLEDQTFDLKVGESTQPIRTRQGFVILKVTEHAAAGAQPMKDVEPQIQEALYIDAMQPALRTYLTKLREDSYVDIQPGFVDSGASAKETKPVFTAYAPPAVKKPKVAKDKARFDRGGHYATVAAPKEVVAGPDTTGGRTLTGCGCAGEDRSDDGACGHCSAGEEFEYGEWQGIEGEAGEGSLWPAAAEYAGCKRGRYGSGEWRRRALDFAGSRRRSRRRHRRTECLAEFRAMRRRERRRRIWKTMR